MAGYRTKTYIAADWEGDHDAVEQLHRWNDGDYWSLSFVDAHEVTQARDGSLNCNIKRSLHKRMDVSKRFVLIVGSATDKVTSGSCRYCRSYNGASQRCVRGYSASNKSYIQYECELAVKAGLDIVVLYKGASVDGSKCPELLRDKGKHVPMWVRKDGKMYWDYSAVKRALA